MPTDDVREARRKPLNQKQKAIAEKAIKIKYNGLINNLRNTPTQVEVDTKNQDHVRTPRMYDWATKDWSKEEGTIDWPDDALAIAVRVAVADKALDALKEEFDGIFKAADEKVREFNKGQDAIRTTAKRARMAICLKLEEERDNAILAVAFDGEDAAAGFLATLPTAASVTARLLADSSYDLSRALPDTTGIGDKMPTSLNTAGTSVRITASDDD